MCNDVEPVRDQPSKQLKESCADAEDDDFSDWMQDMLHDDTPLAAVSLPGSHNSASFAIGPPRLSAIVIASRCQAQDFSAQLHMGIRFFDLRVRPDGTLCHGVISCGNLALRDALGVFSAFLRIHPGEVIIARIKAETRDQSSALAVHTLMCSFAEMFPLFLGPRLPRVGEVRGRVVVLREWALPDETHRFGICWSGEQMQIQDEYRHHSCHEKWRVVMKELVCIKPSSACLQINFTSSTSLPSKTPIRIARGVNPRLACHLRSSLPRFVGIIAMDFPSASLCELIMSRNTQSRDPCRPLVLSTPSLVKNPVTPLEACDVCETLQEQLVLAASKAAEIKLSGTDARWLSHLLVWISVERAVAGLSDSAVVEPSLVGHRTLEVPANQIGTKEMSKRICSAIVSHNDASAGANKTPLLDEFADETRSIDSFVPKTVSGKDPPRRYRGGVKAGGRSGLRCLGTRFFSRCTRA